MDLIRKKEAIYGYKPNESTKTDSTTKLDNGIQRKSKSEPNSPRDARSAVPHATKESRSGSNSPNRSYKEKVRKVYEI